jgi:phosphatidylglycerophosphatase A
MHPLASLLAFGFGSGHAAVAPGTAATLAAIPLYLLLSALPLWSYTALTALCFLGGLSICEVAADHLGVHDHPSIVWDEIVGFLITMTAAPPGWAWIVVGFVWFRLFDIVKPWPIGVADREVHGGLGIMLDDLLAGLCAWGVVQLSALAVQSWS